MEIRLNVGGYLVRKSQTMLKSQNAEPMIGEGQALPRAFLTGKSAIVFQKRFRQPIILLAQK
jgi:hypothetical protein